MRNKSCGNGSKNYVAFRDAMRNGIAIGNPSQKADTLQNWLVLHSRNTIASRKEQFVHIFCVMCSPYRGSLVLLCVLRTTITHLFRK